MWAGVDIEALRGEIYGNFYTQADYDIMTGAEDAPLAAVKRLMNKAEKIGDYETACALDCMYDELLHTPVCHAPLPPRAEMEARCEEILARTKDRLLRARKSAHRG